MKIKTGDNVRVITGKDKGKTGKVLQVFPNIGKVVIEGANHSIKHVKARGKNPGQRVEYTAPIHISNVQLIGKNGMPGRGGKKVIERAGKSVRVRIVKHRKNTEDLE